MPKDGTSLETVGGIHKPAWQIQQEEEMKKKMAGVALKQAGTPLIGGSVTPSSEGTGQAPVTLGAEGGTLNFKTIATTEIDQAEDQKGKDHIEEKKGKWGWLRRLNEALGKS